MIWYDMIWYISMCVCMYVSIHYDYMYTHTHTRASYKTAGVMRWFRVWGLGFRVLGLSLWVLGLQKRKHGVHWNLSTWNKQWLRTCWDHGQTPGIALHWLFTVCTYVCIKCILHIHVWFLYDVSLCKCRFTIYLTLSNTRRGFRW